MIFYSFFKTLVGKEVVVELKGQGEQMFLLAARGLFQK